MHRIPKPSVFAPSTEQPVSSARAVRPPMGQGTPGIPRALAEGERVESAVRMIRKRGPRQGNH